MINGKNVLLLAVMCGVLAAGATAAAGKKEKDGAAKRKAPTKAEAARIERGRFLVTVGGCNDCHTPMAFNAELGGPAPDMSRMLSGHPAGAPDPQGTLGEKDMALIGPTFTSFKLPFGIVYVPNLTPDEETGLGTWTEEMFVKALKTGKHMGGNGRGILPPMPWVNFVHVPDEDLKAMFAYLRSIPAIRNPVPGHKVPEGAIDGITKGNEKLLQHLRSAPH